MSERSEIARKNSVWLGVIPALLALLGVAVGQYLQSQLGLKAQIRINNAQKRQQVYAELMGRKFPTAQLYVSRFEALIYSDYHETKWKRARYPKDSLDLQEAQRWICVGSA